MKKSLKIIFSMMMAFMFILPITLVGCNTAPAENQNTQAKIYDIEARANNTSYGNVYGSGTYAENEQVYLCAIANDGYAFSEWTDGVTTAARRITVTQTKIYTATFVAVSNPTYYALDKVEVYVEKTDTIPTTAKCVRIDGANIYYHHQTISSVGDNQSSITDGTILLDYNPYTDNYDVWATSSNPFYFYSLNSEYNRFEEGSTPTLSVNLRLWCAMFYLDENDQLVSEDGSHGGSLVNNLNLSILPIIPSHLTSTHLVYTDLDHGYKVYVRFNFVEL